MKKTIKKLSAEQLNYLSDLAETEGLKTLGITSHNNFQKVLTNAMIRKYKDIYNN